MRGIPSRKRGWGIEEVRGETVGADRHADAVVWLNERYGAL